MAPKTSTFQRATSSALAIVFLFASGPDAYGLDRCPFHNGHSSTGAISADEPAHAGHAMEFHDSGVQSEGACDWSVDCHACVHSTLHVSSDTADLPDELARAPQGSLEFDRDVLGPRHSLYELHRPNAPPQ